MNSCTIPIHRRLFAQFICALCVLGYCSQASAACGDYLALDANGLGNVRNSVSNHPMRTEHSLHPLPSESLRILLPWQMNQPCSGPDCRQSPPQPDSVSTILLDIRGPVFGVALSPPAPFAEPGDHDSCFPHDDARLFAVTLQGVFRPPLERIFCAL